MADARTLNLHKFESTETADQYTGGKGEVVAVFPEDGSDPSLRIHDGTTEGGWEISCGCEGCSDACKKYIDDKAKYFIPGNLSPVIGICLVKEGGGAGAWARVDGDGQPFEVPPYYFDYHPTYSAIKRVTIDGQVMQEHHKFYYKAFTIESGPYEGRPARCISPYKVDDTWKVFPSFMKNGKEIDTWWCGTYQASDGGGSPKMLASKGGVLPIHTVTHANLIQYAKNRNTKGVTGWGLIDIYQLSEIRLLALIEAESSDSQTAYGKGHLYSGDGGGTTHQKVDSDTVSTGSWRGHVGLWGNIYQWVDGLLYKTTGAVHVWDNKGKQTFVNTGFTATLTPFSGTWYPVSWTMTSGEDFDLSIVFLPDKSTQTLSAASVPDVFAWNNTNGDVYFCSAEDSDGGDIGGLFSMCNAWHTQAVAWIGARLTKTPDPD